MNTPSKRSMELDKIAFKAGDDGLELYAKTWRKAKRKGDVGLPCREALRIEIRKVLEQVIEDCAKIAEGYHYGKIGGVGYFTASKEISKAIRLKLKGGEEDVSA